MSFLMWEHCLTGHKISDAAYDLLEDKERRYYKLIGLPDIKEEPHYRATQEKEKQIFGKQL